MRSYRIKWDSLAIDLSNTDGLLDPLVFFEKLNANEWYDFFDDFFTGRHTDIIAIFFIPPNSDIDHVITYLVDAAGFTKNIIETTIEALLEKYINQKSQDLINSNLNVIRYLELDVNSKYLEDIIIDDTYDDSLRSHAALTLGVIRDVYLSSLWENIDLQKDTFLIPSYLWFFEKSQPVESIKTIAKFYDYPNSINKYDLIDPLKDVLSQISISAYEFDEFYAIHKDLPAWLKSIIDEILGEFEELALLRDKIYKNKKELVDVKLAVSIFPDLILPEYYKELGIFEEYGINLEISYVDWNRIFDELLKKNADYIIANQEVLDVTNVSGKNEPFYPILPIDRFIGFTVIGNEYGMPTFENYYNIYGDQAINNCLKKYMYEFMTGKKIYVSANTDHFITFTELIKLLDVPIDKFKFVNKLDPDQSFFSFLREEQNAFFIGGASHNKNLLNDYPNKYKKIISTEDLIKDSMLKDIITQYNVLVGSNLSSIAFNVKDEIDLKMKFAFDKGYRYIEANFEKAVWDLHKIYEKKVQNKFKNKASLLSLEFDEYYEIIKDIVNFQVDYVISYVHNSHLKTTRKTYSTIQYLEGKDGN